MNAIQDVLPALSLADLLDILLVSILLYVAFVALQRTRTAFLIVGFLVLGITYVVALALGLRLTTFLFQVIFAVILLGLIVIFHAEIRVSVERLFSWRLGRIGHSRGRTRTVPEAVQMIVTVLGDLAKERIGALVVVRGRDDPEHFVHGGVELDGALSEPLLKSIFDPHSLGHDGAVIVSGDRVTRFGTHLPLSSDSRKLKFRGTRHAAALGMSARTDALCLVVSEERGVISIVQGGELREVEKPVELSRALARFYDAMSPERRASFWRDLGTKYLGLKLAALAAAALLWFLVVHESAVAYRSYSVEVQHAGLADAFVVSSINPRQVRVVVSGARRSFYLMNETRFQLAANLLDCRQGEYSIALNVTDLTMPEDLTFVNIVPRTVTVTIEPNPGP